MVSDVSFYFISFHNNHRTTRDFLHFPFYLMPGVAALEVGGEREASITLHVDDADSDAVFPDFGDASPCSHVRLLI